MSHRTRQAVGTACIFGLACWLAAADVRAAPVGVKKGNPVGIKGGNFMPGNLPGQRGNLKAVGAAKKNAQKAIPGQGAGAGNPQQQVMLALQQLMAQLSGARGQANGNMAGIQQALQNLVNALMNAGHKKHHVHHRKKKKRRRHGFGHGMKIVLNITINVGGQGKGGTGQNATAQPGNRVGMRDQVARRLNGNQNAGKPGQGKAGNGARGIVKGGMRQQVGRNAMARAGVTKGRGTRTNLVSLGQVRGHSRRSSATLTGTAKGGGPTARSSTSISRSRAPAHKSKAHK